MKSLDEILEASTRQENVTGDWYQFQWSPDISTGELLNIGVGFKDLSGNLDILMLDYFERISCLYGKDMEFQLELACNVARELAFSHTVSDSVLLTPQIKLTKKGFAQGRTSSEVLDNLYKNTVSLGRKIRKGNKNRFSPVSRDTAYASLKDKLKEKLGIEYAKHVPDDPFEKITDHGVSHNLFLPYKKKNGVATLISTAYSDVQRVKCNLFDGYRDIDIAANLKKIDANAIFLVLPDDTLKQETQIEIENEIDKFIWLLKPHNLYVESDVDTDHLATEISSWCHEAA
ncbi:hypothetical protein J6J08_03610 [Pseudidiomarina sp. 1APR75-33.1]|uniref:hypothetical protein n=1 Tax=Pseudidiomarina terrestris TaxID=2820060 RepID=UPI0026536000|nr:hypothetical protein [Pseudidiomarina sp. 1APR75-33.1]MDN7126463.1 hypothetical protein [Pseudidiomarina sp. 1APR75-33.1]